jgi:His-Xaa-Ser system radical SAM maturase HxsC
MEIPLTLRCNNNCVSCIIFSRLTANQGHFTWAGIKKSIDRLSKSCETVAITGGEPTIANHFFRSMEYLRSMHPEKLVFLVTNARMFSYPKFTERFLDIGIGNLRVGIAIYSHDPRLHDRITRSNGSWTQTMAGIKNLLSKGARIELRIIVSKINFDSLSDTAKFIADNLSGVERVVFINMKYTGNAYRNHEELFIRYSDITQHVSKAVDILKQAGIGVLLFHFPLCTLDEEYQDLARGVTKQKAELDFVKQCQQCGSREQCPMIWKSYLVLAGHNEFRALK